MLTKNELVNNYSDKEQKLAQITWLATNAIYTPCPCLAMNEMEAT